MTPTVWSSVICMFIKPIVALFMTTAVSLLLFVSVISLQLFEYERCDLKANLEARKCSSRMVTIESSRTIEEVCFIRILALTLDTFLYHGIMCVYAFVCLCLFFRMCKSISH